MWLASAWKFALPLVRFKRRITNVGSDLLRAKTKETRLQIYKIKKKSQEFNSNQTRWVIWEVDENEGVG